MNPVGTYNNMIPYFTRVSALKFIFLSLVDFCFGKEISNVFVMEKEKILVNLSIGLFLPIYGFTPRYDFYKYDDVFEAFTNYDVVTMIKWAVELLTEYFVQINYEEPEEYFANNYKNFISK